METRSKVRARSGEFDRSPVKEDTGMEDEATYQTNENIERCDDCDRNINPHEGIYIPNVYICRICYEKLSNSSPFGGIPQSIRMKRSEGPVRYEDPIPEEIISRSNDSFFSYKIILGVILIPAIAFGVYFVSSAGPPLDCKNGTVVMEFLDNFAKKFPSQDENTWYIFASGIMRIYETNPTEPTSFLLFHKNGDETANCLAKIISEFASKCLTGTNDVIDLDSSDLKKEISKDSGELITRYKDKVEEKNVMLVRDINKLPGKIAKEFHYFCDTYQPLVPKAIYFFTMSADDNIAGGRLIKQVEDSFRNIWGSSLDYSKLDPLISRLTGNIILVNSENSYAKSGC